MIRRFGLIFAGLILVCLSACQRGPDVTADEGLRIVEKYMAAVKAGDYDAALALCNPEYFGVRSADEWKLYFQYVRETMGPQEKVTLIQKVDDRRLSGRFLLFQYNIKWEKGFTKDSITIIDKINTNAPLKIFGHKIESSHLRQENS